MTYLAYKLGQMQPYSDRLIMSLGIPSDPLSVHSWIVTGVSPEIIIRLGKVRISHMAREHLLVTH